MPRRADRNRAGLMSAQRLGERRRRRLERNTGLEIVRAWAHGGYIYDFVVAAPEHPGGHVHGWYDSKTKQWELGTPGHTTHYDTCPELFP